MNKFTLEERIKIVVFYLESQRSVSQTQMKFRSFYNTRNSPSSLTIRTLVQKFEETGTVADSRRSGRPRSSRNSKIIGSVRKSVTEDPKTSTRKRCTQLGISRSSLRRILNKDLQMYPYKIQLVQNLNPNDYQLRLQYSRQLLNTNDSDRSFLKNLWMSDEAHFHLNGHVNKQNSRFWGTSNPQILCEHSLYPEKITVWCAVSARRIIGPYFFEENGTTVTVNGNRYREMIQKFFIPNLANELGEAWFQQDGATAHTSRATIELLTSTFGNRLISKNSHFPWPPRSPDLTVADFFLWGYLKDEAYANKPQTLAALKNNIRATIAAITPETLHSVMENVLKRAQICERSGGQHLNEIIFKT